MKRQWRKGFQRAITIILLFSSIAFSQSTSENNDGANRFLDKNWALQFGVSSNFTLTSLQSGLVALQHHFDQVHAVRFIVTGNASKSSYDYDPPPYDRTRSSGSASDAESAGLIAQYVNYINPGADVKVFWAVGPTISFSRSYRSSQTVDTGYVDESSNFSRSWYGGMQTGLGVQWFFHRSLSLQAEYSIDVRFYWTRSTSSGSTRYRSSYSDYSYGNSSNGWSVTGNTSRLILSVYF